MHDDTSQTEHMSTPGEETRSTVRTSEETVGTKITDIQGRFGFLIEKTGLYRIGVRRTSYLFPSKIMRGKTDDYDRHNLYFGENLSLSRPDLIEVSIPLDPTSFDWNQAAKPKQYTPPHFLWKAKVLTVLTYLGLFFSLLVYILDPTNFNLAFLLIYLVVILLDKLFYHPKKWAVVYNRRTRAVMPLVTIRATRDSGAREGLTTTDHLGRYYLLLSEGRHTITVEQTNAAGETNTLATKTVTIPKNQSALAPDVGV